jgi:DNA-binding CsgD family transcriptional regulator
MTMLTARDLQSPKPELLEAALNVLTAGVVLAARDGQVVYMNAAARRQVRTGGALRVVNNRFAPTDPAAAPALTAALAHVLDRSGAASDGHTLALRDRNGVGVLATILPLDADAGDGWGVPSRMAAIFIQDPELTPPFPGEAFAKLYGLTGAESRVLLAMAQGLALQEVAAALGVGLHTVKTHLKHIFQKTGAARQADLVALMLRASGPIRGRDWRQL